MVRLQCIFEICSVTIITVDIFSCAAHITGARYVDAVAGMLLAPLLVLILCVASTAFRWTLRRQFSGPLRRQSSDLIVPPDCLRYQVSRSSGPGGQNVNKVNSKVELRGANDNVVSYAKTHPCFIIQCRLTKLAG